MLPMMNSSIENWMKNSGPRLLLITVIIRNLEFAKSLNIYISASYYNRYNMNVQSCIILTLSHIFSKQEYTRS